MDHSEAFARVEQEQEYIVDVLQRIIAGIGGSTDLGFVLDALKPVKPSVLTAGVARASDLRAHAADEFAYIEDLVSFTKQLVHYFAF